jgi:response regulator RpfG family c-di-GMP phosphodiesterase
MPIVLIADDEPGIRKLVSMTIGADRYTLLEAAEGNQAWELLQQHRPDVVLLDVDMPRRTGFELTRAIRSDPALAHTRVIMLTGQKTEAAIAAGLAAGADQYLTKPFSPLQLLATLDRTLEPGGESTSDGGAVARPAMAPDQQLSYAQDLQQLYQAEQARHRDLERANHDLAAAKAELDRRLDDLLTAQDWILAVNSSRDLPALMNLLAQPLVLLLGAQTTVMFPWDRAAGTLTSVLGWGLPTETPPLAALRTSPLSANILATERRWEVTDVSRAAEEPGLDYCAAQTLGWQALVGVPLVARGERVGLLYVAWTAPQVLGERERTLIDLLAEHTAVALANARQQAESAARLEALQRAEQQLLHYAGDLRRAYNRERAQRVALQAAYRATVQVLAAAIETRDPYTGGHVERVAACAVAIGRELGWDADRLETLELAALLHDIGKIGVEDRVLRKAGRLDPEEGEQMRRHPVLAAHLLRDVPFLQAAAGCALRHHERYDGQGYPDRLAGDTIPVEARVVAVADTFDAMTSNRPYRKGLPRSTALAEIERCAGTQLDPAVVAAFMRAMQAGAIAPARAHVPQTDLLRQGADTVG